MCFDQYSLYRIAILLKLALAPIQKLKMKMLKMKNEMN